jgi:hypothetical protein
VVYKIWNYNLMRQTVVKLHSPGKASKWTTPWCVQLLETLRTQHGQKYVKFFMSVRSHEFNSIACASFWTHRRQKTLCSHTTPLPYVCLQKVQCILIRRVYVLTCRTVILTSRQFEYVSAKSEQLHVNLAFLYWKVRIQGSVNYSGCLKRGTSVIKYYHFPFWH